MKVCYIILLLAFFSGNTSAQQDTIRLDSLSKQLPAPDTATRMSGPKRATIYSAVLPGLGQVYNKKIWKVPIIYGGFFGLGVAVRYNHQRYLKYKKAYIAVTDQDPSTNTELSVLSEGILQSERDAFKKARDLAIIGCVGLYALQILDANVDAHLKEFDIDDNLSMRIAPQTILLPDLTLAPGLRMSFRF